MSIFEEGSPANQKAGEWLWRLALSLFAAVVIAWVFGFSMWALFAISWVD
jgi:hypothetical protein